MTKKQKVDVYEIVTAKIIDSLEKGKIPWRKTWTASESMPMNLVSKKPYRGMNVWTLICSDYSSPYWLTYKQCKQFGGQVRKGEKGTPVVFWNFIERETDEIDSSGNAVVKNIPFLRYYTVFNTDQCDGLEDRIPKIDVGEVREFNPIEYCAQVVEAYPEPKVEIRHGGNRAFYSSGDYIKVPFAKDFESDEAYYATLFHELVHSTGAKKRLNRNMSDAEEDYSKEELVAEFGASYLCALTNIARKELDENTEAYISGWLKHLKNDKKLAVIAAARAQKAVDYITAGLAENPKIEKKETELVAV